MRGLLDFWADKVLEKPLTGEDLMELSQLLSSAKDAIHQTAWDFAFDAFDHVGIRASLFSTRTEWENDLDEAASYADDTWRDFVADGFENLL